MSKKTVKISDVNKEIAEEMAEEKKKEEISKGIEAVTVDEAIKSLMNITVILDKRIDIIKEDLSEIIPTIEKLCKRLGI